MNENDLIKTRHTVVRGVAAILVAVASTMTAAIMDPPYNITPFAADSTDNPPLNYTIVCEPGETNASYVVIGVWYMRSLQGVSAGYAGDLVIPETIEGLPVRKIKDGASSPRIGFA